jgi:hypothetical protein
MGNTQEKKVKNRRRWWIIAALVTGSIAVVVMLLSQPRFYLPGAMAFPTPTSELTGIFPTLTEIQGALPTQTESPGSSVELPIPTQPSPAAQNPDLGALLRQAVAALPEGQMLFNPPERMEQGEKYRVELRVIPVGPEDDANVVQATLESGLRGQGAPQVEPVRVGTIMKASLTGDGFQITPLNEEEQFVTGDTYTEWAWDATALQAGERQLNLRVTVRVSVPGYGERARDYPVKTKVVRVNVDPLYATRAFLGGNWPWITALLLAPALFWAYRSYSRRNAVLENGQEKREPQITGLAPQEYLDFDLEVESASENEYSEYWIRARSQAGGQREKHNFPWDATGLQDQLKGVRAALPRALGTRPQNLPPDHATLQLFGQELFDFLFGGEIRSQYDLIRQRAEAEHKGVRIKLHFLSPQLAALPWEYLYDPRARDYLTLSRDTPVIRSIELPRPVEPLAVIGPLRILGMVANPKDVPQLDVEQEKRRIETALKNLSDKGLVELSWVAGGTWRDLQDVMRGGPWHIFHFIGHGLFDRDDGEGSLVLEGEDGGHQLLSAERLARLLADHNSLRLVILNACESGQGGRELFSGAATALVARGIPAVLAMQYAISDPAAIELARSFYESLADGIPVDAAVAEARKAMEMSSTFEWGIPVLYMHAADGILFKTS